MISNYEWIKIFLETELPDLLQLCSTNRNIRSLCNDNNLWREKIERDYPNLYNTYLPRSYKQLYINRYRLVIQITRWADIVADKLIELKQICPENIDTYNFNRIIYMLKDFHEIIYNSPKIDNLVLIFYLLMLQASITIINPKCLKLINDILDKTYDIFNSILDARYDYPINMTTIGRWNLLDDRMRDLLNRYNVKLIL